MSLCVNLVIQWEDLYFWLDSCTFSTLPFLSNMPGLMGTYKNPRSLLWVSKLFGIKNLFHKGKATARGRLYMVCLFLFLVCCQRKESSWNLGKFICCCDWEPDLYTYDIKQSYHCPQPFAFFESGQVLIVGIKSRINCWN